MKLTLPPQLSLKNFEAALVKFRQAVGKEWVLNSDLDRDAYADMYAPGSYDEWPAAAAIAPASTEEVREIVRIANEFKTPIWPVSRGKNLGYGTAAPRMPGTIVLDLGRMNKIHEVDADLGYCVIEPGVSFFDLYEHLQANKIPLWLSVPGNAWGSVMGNALEHGIGYTPYGKNALNLCGMEVVLPDGDLVRTGMGAMTGNHSSHLFPLSFGPSWEQMFTQSNLGVVTKTGMWLMPEPETSLSLTMDIPKEEDIGWVIDVLAPLKISGIIDQSIFIPSWLGKIIFKGQRKEFWDKPSAMPDWRVQELLKEHNLGYWQVSLRVYGTEDIVKAKAKAIKQAFKRHIKTPFIEEWWVQGDPINAADLSMGVPSANALQMGDWTGGRSGHMSFSPVVPAKSEHILGQLKRSRKLMAEFDLDFYASFTLGGRFANNINMLMFDRNDERQVKNTRALFNALVTETKKAGYGEYRAHIGWMDMVADTFDFNDHALLRLNEKVKNALDPNGILAPGKQGVWPKKYKNLSNK